MPGTRDLQSFVIAKNYARNPGEGWPIIARRIENMFLEYYKDKGIDDIIKNAFKYTISKKVLASQRLAQFAGDAVLKNNIRAFNCSGTVCDRPLVFGHIFYILLSGSGVGISVQKHHVNKLSPVTLAKNEKSITYKIQDSIEGWADAIHVLIANNLELDIPGFEQYNARNGVVRFDYGLIRPEGLPIKSGGVAPGPGPLRRAIKKIKNIFENTKKSYNRRLRPIDCCDIICHICDSVMAGGVRRSAIIVEFSPTDKEMMSAKMGNWYIDNPQRSRANISAAFNINHGTKERFMEILSSSYQYGEPGYLFVDDCETVHNPCAEISFWPYHIVDEQKFKSYIKGYDGLGYKPKNEDIGLDSGFSFCNLCTVNTSDIDSEEDLFLRAEAAAVIGTLQAGLNDMGYIGETSSKIMQRESLIGVSLSGIMVNPDITLNPEIQRKMADRIKKINKEIAEKIGVNQAARTTCIKPDGNTGCVLGCSSSIMPYHSRRYIRYVRSKNNNPIALYFKENNPHAVFNDAMSPGDLVLAFPMEPPKWSKIKYEVPAFELLDAIKSTQQNFVMAGKNIELCSQPYLKNNVSNTVTVKSEDWFKVGEYLWENKEYFGGVTLLREYSGELEYEQAPFTSVAISERELRKRYNIKQDTLEMLSEFITKIIKKVGSVWKYSAELLSNENINEQGSLGKLLRDGKQYVKDYFEDDTQNFIYCIKEIYNFDLYNHLVDNWTRIDYKQLKKHYDATVQAENASAGAACSGSLCVLEI